MNADTAAKVNAREQAEDFHLDDWAKWVQTRDFAAPPWTRGHTLTCTPAAPA